MQKPDPVIILDVEEWVGKTIKVAVEHEECILIRFTDDSCVSLIPGSDYEDGTVDTADVDSYGLVLLGYWSMEDFRTHKRLEDEQDRQRVFQQREAEERCLYERLKRKFGG